MKKEYQVSVGVPTKNRADDLAELFKSLLKQTYPIKEIIVVDQSDNNESALLIEELLRRKEGLTIKYFHSKDIRGICAARNKIISMMDGDVLFFFDDDVVLEPNYIEEILSVYDAYPYVVGVGGIITNNKFMGIKKISIFKKVFMRGIFRDVRLDVYANYDKYSSIVEVKILSGGVCSYKKAVFENNLFDEKMDNIYGGYAFGEDAEFCLRVSTKNKLLISTNAKLVHNHKTFSRTAKERKTLFYLEVMSWSYIFLKNFKTHFLQWICFLWLVVGWSIRSIKNIILFDFSIMVALIKGLWDGIILAFN